VGFLVTAICEHVFVQDFTTDQLAHAIDGLFAIGGGVNAHALNYVREYDRREAYKEDGAASMASWLAFRVGCLPSTASTYVTLARQLADLPLLKDAHERGRLHWDKVVLIATVATRDDEDWWIDEAERNSAARIQYLVRLAKRIKREDVTDIFDARGVWFRADGKGLLHMRAALPEADGALLRKALDRIQKDMGPDNPDGTYNCARMREADALIELASVSLGIDADPDTPQVVVHVDIRDLNKIHGTAILDDGGLLGSEVARRLACDSKLQTVINMPNGDVYAISRNQRTVPRWQRRLLMKRDKGCRFADCGRTRALVPHHIIHWARGGRTVLDNLVLFCPYHHHLVHDGGWDIKLTADLEMRFIRPDGRPLNYRPVPLRESVRERIFGPPREFVSTGPPNRRR